MHAKTKAANVTCPMNSPARRNAVIPTSQHAGHRRAVRQILGHAEIQPKLVVGAPDDKYEREADRMADAVMRMPAPAPHSQNAAPCPSCEAQHQELEQVQTALSQSGPNSRGVQGSFAADAGIETTIRSIRGGGQPLPSELRRFYEPRFGYRFDHVRLHTGDQAARTSQAIHARAFTLGPDIVFGPGQFAPQTASGRHLLAHELTHVIQQGPIGRDIQRQDEPNRSQSLPSPDFDLNWRPSPITFGGLDLDLDLSLGTLDPTGELAIYNWLLMDPDLFELMLTGNIPSARYNLFSLTPWADTLLDPTPWWLLMPPPSAEEESAPSVPGGATLFSAGPARFRVLFEQPSIPEPESLQRINAILNPPSGLDTGGMIKGLITAFLTTTPPGKQILRGITGALGSSEESSGGASFHIDLNLLPTPILQGEPPAFQLMFEIRH